MTNGRRCRISSPVWVMLSSGEKKAVRSSVGYASQGVDHDANQGSSVA